jgi:FlaA1/EpsC-like NDP-sugar epimerase
MKGSWLMTAVNVKRNRKIILIALDTLIVIFSVGLSTLIRFEWDVQPQYLIATLKVLPFIVFTYVAFYFVFGIYSVLWRYAGVRQVLMQTIYTVLAGWFSIIFDWLFKWGISYSVLLNSCMLTAAIAGCSRLFAPGLSTYLNRLSKKQVKIPEQEAQPLLIIGGGITGSYVITLCARMDKAYGRPVAVVDDAIEKQGMKIQNVPVCGTTRDIPRIVSTMGIRNIIIAVPSLKGEHLHEIISLCNTTKCRVRILSDPMRVHSDMQQGILTMRAPNAVDFLSRNEIKLDVDNISGYLKDNTVLVTGGGGSIGSELCRQIMKFAPKKLLIFDIYENSAYELLCEFKHIYGENCPVDVLIGSVLDKLRINQVIKEYKPQVIFHAAAHKHVPLMEASAVEAVKNNIFGTVNLLRAAADNGVERFVQLSTDKAVNPTNIMGATKRVTELLIQLYARETQMKCMAVRFGNVLGSNGSVIPLFEQQIKTGGPVTLTDPNITRYFMTIPEAAQLVLQAGGLAVNGSIFVLDMGKPVRIKDLAEKMIRFYGFEPDVDLPIKIIGLRPGEKLYEELLMDAEKDGLIKTIHEKIFIAPALDSDDKLFHTLLRQMETAAFNGDIKALAILRKIVPNYINNHGIEQEGSVCCIDEDNVVEEMLVLNETVAI